MLMVECKRLHLGAFPARSSLLLRVTPAAALVAFALLVFWIAASCSQRSTPTKPEAERADQYVGTWEIADPGARVREGVSFLMIARESADGNGYVVASEHDREVFRLRDGRLIHDTITILYDDTRDRISHSGLGELIRKEK